MNCKLHVLCKACVKCGASCDYQCKCEIDDIKEIKSRTTVTKRKCKYCGIPKEKDDGQGCVRKSTRIWDGTVKGYHDFGDDQ